MCTVLVHEVLQIHWRHGKARMLHVQVIAARLYSPALGSAVQLLGADDFIAAMEHRGAHNRVAKLKSELSLLWPAAEHQAERDVASALSR